MEVIKSVYQSKDKINKFIDEYFDGWQITLNDIEKIKFEINENIKKILVYQYLLIRIIANF